MALLEGETEAITRKAIELAKGGDTVALRLVLERLLPKSRAIKIDLPMRTLEDLEQAGESVREALAEGAVTLDEVRSLAGLLEARRRLIETTELERRLERLEQARGGKEQLRVVEWWPGEPKPQAEEGELLVILKQYDPRPPSREPGTRRRVGPQR